MTKDKRIVNTSPHERRLDPDDVAKQFGAEPMPAADAARYRGTRREYLVSSFQPRPPGAVPGAVHTTSDGTLIRRSGSGVMRKEAKSSRTQRHEQAVREALEHEAKPYPYVLQWLTEDGIPLVDAQAAVLTLLSHRVLTFDEQGLLTFAMQEQDLPPYCHWCCTRHFGERRESLGARSIFCPGPLVERPESWNDHHE